MSRKIGNWVCKKHSSNWATTCIRKCHKKLHRSIPTKDKTRRHSRARHLVRNAKTPNLSAVLASRRLPLCYAAECDTLLPVGVSAVPPPLTPRPFLHYDGVICGHFWAYLAVISRAPNNTAVRHVENGLSPVMTVMLLIGTAGA